MKKNVLLHPFSILLAGVALISLAGCRPTRVTVTPETATVKTGESITLAASSTSKKDVAFIWTSNQTEVAAVDALGKVTGVKPGIASIHATGSYSKKQAKTLVTVLPSATPEKPEPVKPEPPKEEKKPPKEVPIKEAPPVEGETAEGQPGEGVSTEGLAEGEGAPEASPEAPAQSETPPPPPPPPAIKVSHTPDMLVLTEGGTAYITPISTSPADKAFTWASTNDAVASITPQGQVKAVGAGVAYITSTAVQSGAQGSTKMIVTAAAHANDTQAQPSTEGEYQFLTVYPGNVSLQVGQSVTLNVTSPSALDTGFTWTSTNAAVATVNASGQVTAVGEGSAFIIAVSPYTLSQGLASIVVAAAEGQAAP